MPISIDILTENCDNIFMRGTELYLNGIKIVESPQVKCVGKPCYGSGHYRLIKEFYSCVKENKPFGIDGKEGAKVIKLILSAYKSKGERVKI